MAVRLIRRSRRRAIAWLVLVAAVMVLHVVAVQHVPLGRWEAGGPDNAMPPRIEVAFVQELVPQPPPVATPAPEPRRPARARPAARAGSPPARAASAAAAAPARESASAPQPPAEQAVDVAQAWQEPAEEPAPPSGELNVHEHVPPAPAPEASSAVQPSDRAQASGTGQYALAGAPADAASSPGTARPFEWPPSTQLSYTLRGYYRGDFEGTAKVEWIKAGSRYQVHLDVFAGLLFSRRMTSDGELTEDGLRPRRYDERTRIALSSPRHVTMHFEPGQAVLASGRRVAAPPDVQDTASQFVQLTWMCVTQRLRLRPGAQIEVPLALPRRVKRVVFDVVGEERLETPIGPLDTFRLVPRQDARRGTDLTAEVWVAPALLYLPVRILIHQDAETWIDLGLRTAPLLEAAAAVRPPAPR